MLCLRTTLLIACCTSSLAAQVPAAELPRESLPIVQSLSIDLAAALDERARISVAPLVFGRFTFGLTAALTTVADAEPFGVYPLALSGTRIMSIAPCLIDYPCGSPAFGKPRYRASSLSLDARWYPQALSRESEGQRLAVYIGEFLVRHERRIEWPQWVSPPIYPPMYPPTDSLIIIDPPYPWPIPFPGPTVMQRLSGWEPGAEIGVRVMMGGRLLLDVGGSVRLVTLDDPLSRRRPGDTDARMVAAVGISW